MGTQPVVFVGHGSPGTVLEEPKKTGWRAWGATLGRPDAILAVSAHWEDSPLLAGETIRHQHLFYDFGGFPAPLYQLRYPAPGAPELAARVSSLLGALAGPRSAEQDFMSTSPVAPSTDRPLDHGVWMPLLHMFRSADIPVLQLSMPFDFSDIRLYELGRRLAPLREEGVLLLTSGNLVHNIMRPRPPRVPDYAIRFDSWIAEAIKARDDLSLLDWRRHPDARDSHPTAEHFRPLFVALGAAEDREVSWPLEGFEHSTVSLRCVQFV